ncbi:MAG: hypothetical protein AAF629_15360 [Chloroflexota bacterium]
MSKLIYPLMLLMFALAGCVNGVQTLPLAPLPAETEQTIVTAPDDMAAYLVYMGEAIIDPAAESPLEGVPRIPIFPVDLEGRPYQEIVMGRSVAFIDQREAAAKAFFLDRFGVNVDDPELAERITFFDAVTSPELRYNVYAISGMAVPKSGFKMHDTVWLTMVTDPEGLTLGGDFMDVHVPQGAILVWGEYYIVTDDEPIIIQVQSVEPMIMDAQGNAALVCEIIHPEWGYGLAQGLFKVTPLEDGTMKMAVRNVLTFPSQQ